MEDLLKEIYSSFKEKISSPFFRFFTISWILCNYKFVYFIFFQDETLFFNYHKITKFDYLMVNKFFYETWYYNLLLFLILPILSTLFFIYIFPKINIYFFKEYYKSIKKEDDLKYEYKEFIKNKDIELTKLELKEKKEETKVIKEEVKKTVVKNKKENLDKNSEIYKVNEWKKEYESFKNTEVYKSFSKIIELINFNQWDFRLNNAWFYTDHFVVNKESISYLIANKIIEKLQSSSDYHKFTEKWDYFAKLYLEENKK